MNLSSGVRIVRIRSFPVWSLSRHDRCVIQCAQSTNVGLRIRGEGSRSATVDSSERKQLRERKIFSLHLKIDKILISLIRFNPETKEINWTVYIPRTSRMKIDRKNCDVGTIQVSPQKFRSESGLRGLQRCNNDCRAFNEAIVCDRQNILV